MTQERQGSLWPGDIPGDPGEDRAQAIRDGDSRHAERKRAARAAERVVNIPPVADPERRRSCERALRRFIETYLAAAFSIPWGKPHLRIIKRLEDCILRGKKYTLAAPRGTGKSALIAAAILWAILYGHRRFLALLCDTYDNSKSRLNTIRTWVETNDRLFADFPGPCACVRALEGVWNRANAQTVADVDGKPRRTQIKWGEGATLLAFPEVPGEPSSGARIATRSMEKSVRGIYDTLPSGEIIRPDLAILDDPIKIDEAHSEAIVDKLERKIQADVMNLAGPDVALSAVMLVTVIADNDLASRYLDHNRHPDWQGERIPFFTSMPTDMEAWEAYNDARERSLEEFHDIRLATEFYIKHQAKLDAGAAVTWEHRYIEAAGEVSAIQHGMNRYFELGPDVFAAEYQNDPPQLDDTALLILSSAAVEGSNSGFKRSVVSPLALALAGGWDVGKFGIHWAVGAGACGRVLSIIDYGVQGIDAPTGKVDPKDRERMKALELAIMEGLCRLRDKFADEPYLTEDGQERAILQTLVDRGWMPAVIDAFCAASGPAYESFHGCGTSKNQPRYYVPRGAATTHDSNVYRKRESDGATLHYYAHADALKQIVHTGFLLPSGEPGSIALFPGEHRKTHHAFARHLTAEMPVEIAPGQVKWQPRRGRADNHWLDATYAMVAAFSILEHRIPALAVGATGEGVASAATPGGFVKRKRRIITSEL